MSENKDWGFGDRLLVMKLNQPGDTPELRAKAERFAAESFRLDRLQRRPSPPVDLVKTIYTETWGMARYLVWGQTQPASSEPFEIRI